MGEEYVAVLLLTESIKQHFVVICVLVSPWPPAPTLRVTSSFTCASPWGMQSASLLLTELIKQHFAIISVLDSPQPPAPNFNVGAKCV